MKIAFVSTYDFAIPGGVKNHVCQLADTFSSQGNTVHIIAPSSADATTNQIANFIPVAKFPSAAKTGFIPPHLLLSPKALPRLKQIFNAENYDLIHIHEPLIPPLCLSALRYKKTPLFATFHTYYEQGQPLYRLFRPLFQQWLRQLRGRIAVSVPAKNYIAQYFPYDYKIIPNGIDLDKFSGNLTQLELTAGYTNLLFVGHAQFKRKGLRYMLEAYRILKKRYPRLRLIVAGARWSGRSQPVELIDSDLPDILYLGTVSDAQLAALYQTADIFCAPSIGNESFGIVLLEAMAAGVPIVTTDIDGYASVVKDREDALIVPPRDSVALAQSIQELLETPRLRQQLIEQGKQRVQRFSWHRVAQEIMDYYLYQLGTARS